MGGARIAGFAGDKLSAEAEASDGEIRARVIGTASQREVGVLDGFLGAIVRAATSGAPTTVALDLRELSYMNSSHFKLLVSMVAKLQKSGAPVILRLRSNDAYHWQKRSLPALKHLADELVVLE